VNIRKELSSLQKNASTKILEKTQEQRTRVKTLEQENFQIERELHDLQAKFVKL
jgi:hypothetical protein